MCYSAATIRVHVPLEKDLGTPQLGGDDNEPVHYLHRRYDCCCCYSVKGTRTDWGSGDCAVGAAGQGGVSSGGKAQGFRVEQPSPSFPGSTFSNNGNDHAGRINTDLYRIILELTEKGVNFKVASAQCTVWCSNVLEETSDAQVPGSKMPMSLRRSRTQTPKMQQPRHRARPTVQAMFG